MRWPYAYAAVIDSVFSAPFTWCPTVRPAAALVGGRADRLGRVSPAATPCWKHCVPLAPWARLAPTRSTWTLRRPMALGVSRLRTPPSMCSTTYWGRSSPSRFGPPQTFGRRYSRRFGRLHTSPGSFALVSPWLSSGTSTSTSKGSGFSIRVASAQDHSTRPSACRLSEEVRHNKHMVAVGRGP